MTIFRDLNMKVLSSGEEDSLSDERDTQEHHSPYLWEKQLIRYIREGDRAMVEKFFALAEQAGTRVGKLSENELRQAQYHAVVLSYQASRAAIDGGMFEAEAYQRVDTFVQRIDKETSVQKVLAMTLQVILEWTQAVANVRYRQELSPSIRNCQEYIFENLNSKITLDQLAKVSGFSVPYLSAVFKKEVGQTISAYILDLKIKTAQEMLLTSRRTSKNIAFLLNFSSQSYFIHCFKRITGVTPRQFREGVNN